MKAGICFFQLGIVWALFRARHLVSGEQLQVIEQRGTPGHASLVEPVQELWLVLGQVALPAPMPCILDPVLPSGLDIFGGDSPEAHC